MDLSDIMGKIKDFASSQATAAQQWEDNPLSENINSDNEKVAHKAQSMMKSGYFTDYLPAANSWNALEAEIPTYSFDGTLPKWVEEENYSVFSPEISDYLSGNMNQDELWNAMVAKAPDVSGLYDFAGEFSRDDAKDDFFKRAVSDGLTLGGIDDLYRDSNLKEMQESQRSYYHGLIDAAREAGVSPDILGDVVELGRRDVMNRFGNGEEDWNEFVRNNADNEDIWKGVYGTDARYAIRDFLDPRFYGGTMRGSDFNQQEWWDSWHGDNNSQREFQNLVQDLNQSSSSRRRFAEEASESGNGYVVAPGGYRSMFETEEPVSGEGADMRHLISAYANRDEGNESAKNYVGKSMSELADEGYWFSDDFANRFGTDSEGNYSAPIEQSIYAPITYDNAKALAKDIRKNPEWYDDSEIDARRAQPTEETVNNIQESEPENKNATNSAKFWQKTFEGLNMINPLG